ncbi:substrate-binding periplasmic protein [Niveispirillum sp. KHB5.9]|uniref:substrate-binding periplasmic protein n=1 Tax=Niveispirillum sp. KHB5.9 TaxID=3400269 RepID=UPI003A84E8F2
MSRWMAIAWLALVPALTVSGAEPEVVRVSDWRGPGDDVERPDYFHDLFRRLMVETAPRYGAVRVETVNDRFSQGRLLAELKAGRIDVTWTGTNIEREKQGHPIRIPIDMGLIGQRVPIIRATDAAAFAQVRSVQDLKRFTACQGAQWPDADVLAASGLPQVTNVYFDQLYAMLRAGRCDYFARGLAEVAGEFETYGGPDLMVFDKLVVAYPMPVYFYVAPNLDTLARRLEEGLRAMLASGELRRMLSTHPSTRGAFPLERFNDATIIRLPNPNLPPATPLSDPTLWLSVGRTGQGPS